MFSHEEKKILNKKMLIDVVKRILPTYVILTAQNEGKIYGYKVFQKIKKDFNFYLSPSEGYPIFWKAKKQNLLESRNVIKNGRLRKEYYTIEPNATQYVDTVIKTEEYVLTRLKELRDKAQRNLNDNLEFRVLIPDKFYKWRNKAGFN